MLFEALQARGNEGPPWLKIEVADAYLAVRRPVHAELLYRQSLASTPDSFNAKLGLFYALSDQGKADEAMTQIDAVVIDLPQRRRRDGGANEERLSAEIVSAQARLYADQIAETQQRLAQHENEVPFNGEVRQALAGLAQARGWQRAGETELRRAIAQDPSNAGLHAGRAEVLLGLQRWREADAELQLARELDDSNPRVQQAVKNFEIQHRPEWNTEVGYGNGENSSPLGSIDWQFDSWLYSPPIYSQHKHSNWRAFVHHNSTNAEFDAAMTRWQRTGVGVQWRAGNWQASGEINEGYDFDPGVLTAVSWQPDDHWKLSAAAEVLSNDVSMQAVRAGITVNRYALGVDWAAHEARSIGMAVGQNDFTDGNLRNSFAVSWFERWYSSSAWQFETRLGADMTRNSIGYMAVYFNPPTDHSVWGSAAAENLLWRDYASSLRQRLVISVGSYWQEGFGADHIQAIEYEHRWELGPSASLLYGISHSQRPYDGDRETRTSGAANFLWRF